MTFLEERFDARIAFGAVGGPVWSTTKAYAPGGDRAVNRNRTYPLHKYEVSQGIRKNSDFEYVRAFFWNVYGAFDGFRFKDWVDFEVTTDIGTTSLVSGSIYQLERLYSISTRNFRRPIKKPVAGTVLIYRTRSSVTTNITGASTIDVTTGQVTVTGHMDGDVYTWAGEFDVPVAFVNDNMDAEIVNRNGPRGELLMSWPSIQLEEIPIRAAS